MGTIWDWRSREFPEAEGRENERGWLRSQIRTARTPFAPSIRFFESGGTGAAQSYIGPNLP
jgi:hypothetical protein